MKKLSILRIMLAVYVANLDPFEKLIWVDLSIGNTLESTITNEVAKITEAIMALTWEAACCATPNIKNIRVEALVENITYNGTYKRALLPHNSVFTGWSPELSKLVNVATAQIRMDISGMLAAMVQTTPERNSAGGNCPYEIRQRT